MKRIAFWLLAVALLLSACRPSGSPPPESASPPPSDIVTDIPASTEPAIVPSETPPVSEPPVVTPSPPPESLWKRENAALLCDYETLELLDDSAQSNAQIESVLMGHDALLYAAAVVTGHMTRYSYNADFNNEQDTAFLWRILRELLLYHSVMEVGGQTDWVELSHELVRACYNDWFRPGPGENLPAPPDSLTDRVQAGDGVYLLRPGQSEIPSVTLLLAYSDIDEWDREILSVYLSISFSHEEYPTEAYLSLRPENGGYILNSYGLIADGDSLQVSHIVTERQIVIELPEELELTENNPRSVRLDSEWGGVTAEIDLLPLARPLGELAEEYWAAAGSVVTRYTARLGEEYGCISYRDGQFHYGVLFQLSADEYVRVAVTVSEDWVYDYYLLAERIALAFGADGFPQEAYDDLDDFMDGYGGLAF